MVNIVHSSCILGSEGSRCGHGIAAMGRNDLLIRLKTTDITSRISDYWVVRRTWGLGLGGLGRVGMYERSAGAV